MYFSLSVPVNVDQPLAKCQSFTVEVLQLHGQTSINIRKIFPCAKSNSLLFSVFLLTLKMTFLVGESCLFAHYPKQFLLLDPDAKNMETVVQMKRRI